MNGKRKIGKRIVALTLVLTIVLSTVYPDILPMFSTTTFAENVNSSDGSSKDVVNANTTRAYVSRVYPNNYQDSEKLRKALSLVYDATNNNVSEDDAYAAVLPYIFSSGDDMSNAGGMIVNSLGSLQDSYRAIGCTAPIDTFSQYSDAFTLAAICISATQCLYALKTEGTDSDAFKQSSANLGLSVTTAALFNMVSEQGASMVSMGEAGGIISTGVAPAVLASQFFVAAIGYAINSNYSMMIAANERKYYDMYKAFYKEEMPREEEYWRNYIVKLMEERNTPAQIQTKLMKHVDEYVEYFFSHEEEIAIQYSEQQKKIWGVMGGYNESLRKKIEDSFRYELYNGPIKSVWTWYVNIADQNMYDAACDAASKAARFFNKTVRVAFIDENAGNGSSNMMGYKVRFKEIPDNITDPENLSCTINKRGVGVIRFNNWAAIEYGFKPTVEIVNIDNEVVKELNFEWDFNENEINIGLDLSYNLSESELLFVTPEDSASLKLIKTEDGNTSDVEDAKWKLKGKDTSCIQMKVENGTATIKPVKNGTANVICEYEKNEYVCEVAVAFEDVIELSSDYIEITDIETTHKVSLLKIPGDTTEDQEILKTDWYIDSGDKDCVEMGTNGSGVLSIKGVKNGELKVFCEYEGEQYFCDIVVNIDPTKVTLSRKSVLLSDTETGVSVYREYTDEKGDTKIYKEDDYSFAKYWKTSDPSKKVFSMEDSGDGGIVLIGNAPGKGQVTTIDKNGNNLTLDVTVGIVKLSMSSIKIESASEAYSLYLIMDNGTEDPEYLNISNWQVSGDCIKGVANAGGIGITGVSMGKATVSCEYEGKTYTCPVEVTFVELPITSEVFEGSYHVQRGNSFTIPSGFDNQEAKWSSQKEQYATVDENGTVYGKSTAGNAVTYIYGDKDGVRHKWEVFVVEDVARNGTPFN